MKVLITLSKSSTYKELIQFSRWSDIFTQMRDRLSLRNLDDIDTLMANLNFDAVWLRRILNQRRTDIANSM